MNDVYGFILIYLIFELDLLKTNFLNLLLVTFYEI